VEDHPRNQFTRSDAPSKVSEDVAPGGLVVGADLGVCGRASIRQFRGLMPDSIDDESPQTEPDTAAGDAPYLVVERRPDDVVVARLVTVIPSLNVTPLGGIASSLRHCNNSAMRSRPKRILPAGQTPVVPRAADSIVGAIPHVEGVQRSAMVLPNDEPPEVCQ
jgi:hypothetical protein